MRASMSAWAPVDVHACEDAYAHACMWGSLVQTNVYMIGGQRRIEDLAYLRVGCGDGAGEEEGIGGEEHEDREFDLVHCANVRATHVDMYAHVCAYANTHA